MSFMFTLFLLIFDSGLDENISIEMDFAYPTLFECELNQVIVETGLLHGKFGEVEEWVLSECKEQE